MYSHASIEGFRTVLFALLIVGPALLCMLASLAPVLFPANTFGAEIELEMADSHVAVRTARSLFERAAYTEVMNARMAQAGRHAEINHHAPHALRMRAAMILASVVGGVS